jgi:catechol 2,3-dioxygenase-like lactoylglutathione lyase family enzyme
MLAAARLQTLVWTSRLAEATAFYRDVLGLPFRCSEHGASVFDVGGGVLRVAPVSSTTPSAHTIFGFGVADAYATVAWLKTRGVAFERFPGIPHDEHGVFTLPDGAKVAWFRDPDGNIFSVVQYCGAAAI